MQKLHNVQHWKGKPQNIYYILIFGGKIKITLRKMKIKIAFKYYKERTHVILNIT